MLNSNKIYPLKFRDMYFPQMKNISYLASCGLGACSEKLVLSMDSMLKSMIEPKLAWSRFESELKFLRENIAQLIGAKIEQIAILPNASIGAYQVASCLNWKYRKNIIYTNDEFPSIANVWVAQTPRGTKVHSINTQLNNKKIISQFNKVMNKNTGLVSIPYSSYIDGKNLPVRSIINDAHAVGAKVFIDAYHAVGVQSIDIAELGCDYLLGGTMKYLLGLPGVAFLYVKDYNNFDQLPQLTGWFGRKNQFDYDPNHLDFAEGASRFESGTPSIPSVYAANAGILLISQININTIRQHVVYLTKYAAERLRLQGEVLLRHPDLEEHGSHIALVDNNPALLSDYLEMHSIVSSPMNNSLRVSFHYYNLVSDIDYLCEILKSYRAGNQNEEK